MICGDRSLGRWPAEIRFESMGIVDAYPRRKPALSDAGYPTKYAVARQDHRKSSTSQHPFAARPRRSRKRLPRCRLLAPLPESTTVKVRVLSGLKRIVE